MNHKFYSTFLFLIAFLFLSIQSNYAAWYNLGSKREVPIDVDVLSADKSGTTIRFRVLGFNYDSISIDHKEYYNITIPDASLTEKRGYPELPRLSKNILIPVTPHSVTYSVKDLKRKTIKLGIPNPSKGVLSRATNPASVPYSFDPFYESGETYPLNSLLLGKPFILRNTKGINLTFIPIQYASGKKELTVITEAIVKINTNPISNRISTVLFDRRKKDDPDFLSIYKNHYINYKTFTEDGEIAPEKLVSEKNRILIISHESFVETLKPFVDWKREKGFDVKLATPSETGVVYTAIKDFIQNDFSLYGTSYVILVGDAEFVPYYEGTAGNAKGNEADPMYGLVAGDDSYPDLFVSRLSVKTSEELSVIISKSINYEKNPDLEGEWYGKGTGIASDEGTPKDKERAEWLREMLEKWHYTSVDKLYDPGVKASQVSDVLNEGRGFVNYIGHGSETYWVTSHFSNSDIDKLSNGTKLPFIVSVACVNGNFGEGSDVFAERWIKAGTVDSPKGAIAIYASSTNQSWVPPTLGQKEIVNLLTEEKVNTIGGLFFNGVMAVLEDNSDSAEQTFQTWHIFGDGSIQVRTKKPEKIDISLPSSLIVGQNTLNLNTGTKGVRIGIVQDGNQIATGLSDQNGQIDLVFTGPLAKPGNALFTLTGFNKIPLIQSIPINVPLSFSFAPQSRSIEEAMWGTDVTLSLKNMDGTPATGVSVWIEGIDYKSDESTTDENGVAVIKFKYEFGPSVTIKGKRNTEDFYILNESYSITGAHNLSGKINLTNDVNLDGAFAVGFPGTIKYDLRRGASIYLFHKDKIVAQSNSSSLAYTPVQVGNYEAVVVASGFNILKSSFKAIEGFGDFSVKVLTQDEKILKGAFVVLNSRGKLHRELSGFTGEDGITFKKIPIGNYSVTISKFGFEKSVTAKFVKYGTNGLFVTLIDAPKYQLKGVVTLESVPVLSTIKIFKDNETSLYAIAESGEDGVYSIDLPAYTYKLVISAKGGKLKVVTQDILTNLDLSFDLEKSSGILILYRDASYDGSSKSAQIMKAILEQIGISVVLDEFKKTDPSKWFDYTAIVAVNSMAGTRFEISEKILEFVKNGGKLLVEGGDTAYAYQSEKQFMNTVLLSKKFLHESIGELLFPENSPIITSAPVNIETGVLASDTLLPDDGITILATSKNYPEDATIVTNGSNIFISLDVNQIKNKSGERDELLTKLLKFWLGI